MELERIGQVRARVQRAAASHSSISEISLRLIDANILWDGVLVQVDNAITDDIAVAGILSLLGITEEPVVSEGRRRLVEYHPALVHSDLMPLLQGEVEEEKRGPHFQHLYHLLKDDYPVIGDSPHNCPRCGADAYILWYDANEDDGDRAAQEPYCNGCVFGSEKPLAKPPILIEVAGKTLGILREELGYPLRASSQPTSEPEPEPDNGLTPAEGEGKTLARILRLSDPAHWIEVNAILGQLQERNREDGRNWALIVYGMAPDAEQWPFSTYCLLCTEINQDESIRTPPVAWMYETSLRYKVRPVGDTFEEIGWAGLCSECLEGAYDIQV